MRGFRQQKQNIVRILGLRILTVILLLILFVLMRGSWSVYQKERETRGNRENAEARLLELEDRKLQLQNEVLRLKSDRGVEQELRQQFEVAREGEGLIVIVDRPESENESDLLQKRPWWRSILLQ